MKKFYLISLLGLGFVIGAAAEPEKKGKRPGPSGLPTREQILEKFDLDGDGELNEEERAALVAERKDRFKNSPMFARIDTDGDGEISEEEKAVAKAKREEMIKRFDKDGDGKLDQKERRALMEELRKGGEGKGSNRPRRERPSKKN